MSCSLSRRDDQRLTETTRVVPLPDGIASLIKQALQVMQSASPGANLELYRLESEEQLLSVLSLALTPPGEPERGARGSRLRSLVRTREYIAANLDSPLGLETLAQVAEVSTRTLNTAFREVLNVTVVQYIRQCRLNAVKHRLLYPDSTHSTVASVGRAFGFTHLSRFAGEYHALFDEYPETLKKNKSEKHLELH